MRAHDVSLCLILKIEFGAVTLLAAPLPVFGRANQSVRELWGKGPQLSCRYAIGKTLINLERVTLILTIARSVAARSLQSGKRVTASSETKKRAS